LTGLYKEELKIYVGSNIWMITEEYKGKEVNYEEIDNFFEEILKNETK